MFGESEFLWKVVFLCVTCTSWNDVMGMPQYETGHTDGHHENLGVIDPSVVFYDHGGLYSGLVAADVPETVTDPYRNNSTSFNDVDSFETATVSPLPSYNSLDEPNSMEIITTKVTTEMPESNEITGTPTETNVELVTENPGKQEVGQNPENFTIPIIPPATIEQVSSPSPDTSSEPILPPPVVDQEPETVTKPLETTEDSTSHLNDQVTSNPNVLLIPPPPGSEKAPDVPREPEPGQVPESQVDVPLHPFNLRDIPISLISLSGNSGGSNSDMATYLVSPSSNAPVDFTRFRYHVVTGQLLKIGSTGPGVCPPNMRFFAVPGHPKNGACDCDYYQCSRPLIYSPEKHQCYWAWSQGPCDKGDWFVFDADLKRRGICEKNPCSTVSIGTAYNDTDTEYFFQNPSDKTCLQAGTNNGHCGDPDERLLMYPGEPIPKCRKFTVCYPLTVPQELQCIYGNKYFVEGGQCQ